MATTVEQRCNICGDVLTDDNDTGYGYCERHAESMDQVWAEGMWLEAMGERGVLPLGLENYGD